MGYFHADERYLTGAKASTVEAPWKVEMQETGVPGQVRLTWRPPYTPADSYAVYARPAGPPPGDWRELARVPGSATTADLALAPGAWRLAVAAQRAGAASPLVEAGRTTPSPGGAVVQVAAAIPSVPPVGDDGRRTVDDDAATGWQAAGDRQQAAVGGQQMATDVQQATSNTQLPGCTCCTPPRPLVWQGSAWVCPAHPGQRYGVPLPWGAGRNDPPARRPAPAAPPAAPPPVLVPEPAPDLEWTAIDAALRANSAHLGRHGLFVRPTRPDYDDRR